MRGVAVRIVPSGGLPVTEVAEGAPLLIEVEEGGIAVPLTDNAAPFVIEHLP